MRADAAEPHVHRGAGLSPQQHRARERSLTRHHASGERMPGDAIVLKWDELFLVADPSGDVVVGENRGLGLFYRDTRFLSRYELRIEDQSLIPLSSLHTGGDWVIHDLENCELTSAPTHTAAHKLAVCRYRTAGDAQLHELVRITNYDLQAARFRLRVHYESDFADIFQVRSLSGHVPEQKTRFDLTAERVRIACRGQDGWERSIELRFSPLPQRLKERTAEFDVSLEPHAAALIDIRLQLAVQDGRRHGRGEASDEGPRNGALRRDRHEAPDPRELTDHTPPHGQELLEQAAHVEGQAVLDKIIRRSLLDLSLLRGQLEPGLHFIAGGVPWYVTLFGRDSALSTLQVCAWRPAIAGQTARLLARYQATHHDDFRDAQPGKILHELRRGQLSHLDEIPQSPAYYGSIDSTLLFLILISEYAGWSGDLRLVRDLRPNIEASLAWIDRDGDSDGDGYLEYGGESEGHRYSHGLVNQGWKDSGDAIVNADGSLVQPPVALCEVQGYLYRAWCGTSSLLQQLGDRAGAQTLGRQADELRERFERDFWSDELGCYLLARQHAGRPAAVISSNAGQVLWSGISSAAHASRVIERMMAPDMFGGWGVRTLSSREKRYNPLSYHLGSVWPHDNSLICAGFRRYGANTQALRIFDALFDAASGFRDHRMPELYCGLPRRPEECHPVRYPVACSPQAWAAGSIPYALTSLLGLQPDALHEELHVVDPCLPDWLARLWLRQLQVGQACVDLLFERDAHDRVHVEANVRAGTIRVRQQFTR